MHYLDTLMSNETSIHIITPHCNDILFFSKGHRSNCKISFTAVFGFHGNESSTGAIEVQHFVASHLG